jgi:DNA-binding XRE family transcriptional regulator
VSNLKLKGGSSMKKYTEEELAEALQLVSSTISNCEKMQPKFAEGTSQHTLLKNRIKALYISKSLITNEDVIDKYTKEELMKALPPVSSIIHKCEKAQLKFVNGTSQHTRLRKIIKAMYISKSLITDEISKRG